MRVEQYVGQRIRERRDELGMTQEEFGRQVGQLLGKPWSRSTVSVAENGKRAFTAAELVAIAHVLDTSASRLFMPPPGIGEISMPSGATLPARALPIARFPEDLNLAAIYETLDLLAESAAQSRRDAARSEEGAARTQELTEDLNRLFVRRLAEGGVVRGQSAQGMIAAAIVTSDLRVLVGRRNDGKPPWTFIAGEQEPGESPADTIVREVKEETGLEVEAGESIGLRVHPKTGRTMIYVTGRPVRGTDVFVGDEAELAEVRWVTLAEADELLPGMYEPVREYLAREIGAAESHDDHGANP